MQWSIRRAIDDAVFAWITLPVSILISAFLFAILSVNHFSEIVSIFASFGVMCIILTGAHVLRHRSDVLVPLAKELIRLNVLQVETQKPVRLKKEDIEISIRIIQNKKRIINALREQLADPCIPLAERVNIEAKIKKLEEEIEAEAETFKPNVEILYTLDGAKVETVLKELKELYEKSSD
jgi:hypothetical protein